MAAFGLMRKSALLPRLAEQWCSETEKDPGKTGGR